MRAAPRPRPWRAACAAAALALGSAGSCAAPKATTALCAYETGDVLSGRCITYCESRCARFGVAGCRQPRDCKDDCQAWFDPLPDACKDALYRHWRCLRLEAEPQARCPDGSPPALSFPTDSCVAELEAKNAACPQVPDAGLDGPDGSEDASADARPRD